MVEIEEVKNRSQQFGYKVECINDKSISFNINKIENEVKNICNTNKIRIRHGIKPKAIDKICSYFLGGKLASMPSKLNEMKQVQYGKYYSI